MLLLRQARTGRKRGTGGILKRAAAGRKARKISFAPGAGDDEIEESSEEEEVVRPPAKRAARGAAAGKALSCMPLQALDLACPWRAAPHSMPYPTWARSICNGCHVPPLAISHELLSTCTLPLPTLQMQAPPRRAARCATSTPTPAHWVPCPPSRRRSRRRSSSRGRAPSASAGLRPATLCATWPAAVAAAGRRPRQTACWRPRVRRPLLHRLLRQFCRLLSVIIGYYRLHAVTAVCYRGPWSGKGNALAVCIAALGQVQWAACSRNGLLPAGVCFPLHWHSL